MEWYSQATQNKFWKFSKKELEKQRQLTNELNQGKISLKEESFIRFHYEEQILSKRFELLKSKTPIYTATIYFKRFYLFQPVSSYDPQKIMATCIYIACKTEETRIEHSDIATIFDIKDPSVILQLEMTVLEVLKFHLSVYHPFKSLRGLKEDLKSHGIELPSKTWEIAEKFVESTLTTDICFYFSPAQIALSCLYSKSTEEGKQQIDKYIQEVLSAHASQIRNIFQEISNLIKEKKQEYMEYKDKNMDEILAKLK